MIIYLFVWNGPSSRMQQNKCFSRFAMLIIMNIQICGSTVDFLKWGSQLLGCFDYTGLDYHYLSTNFFCFSCHRELDKNRIRHENMPPFQNKLEGRHKEHYYRYKSENHFVFIGKMELSTARAGWVLRWRAAFAEKASKYLFKEAPVDAYSFLPQK